MLESIITIGVVLIIVYFIVYALYSQNIKAESDFAKDVYFFLIRRYPTTKIIDQGGLSSDPIIEASNAGPFKSLEIKVITNKTGGTTDRDLILRGVIDKTKFSQSSNERLNLLISPEITWSDSSSRVKLGDSRFDQRFKISADNSIFVHDLFREKELREMLRNNYDLEAFSLYWYQDGTTVIQVRMESMTSNSFLNAYNMVLATVGILNQRGYLIKPGKIPEEPGTQLWSAKTPSIHATDYSEEKYVQKYQPEDTTYQVQELPKIKLHPQRDQRRLDEKQGIKHYEEVDKKIDRIANSTEVKTISEDLISLFTSIRYQVKNITYSDHSVQLETFSSQLEVVNVTFPSVDQILLSGVSIQIPQNDFSLHITNTHESRSPSWENPWKEIDIKGNEFIVKQLKHRTAIANRIKELGTMKIDITGSKNGIKYDILGLKSKEGITIGYSLLLDLVWFFEMIE